MSKFIIPLDKPRITSNYGWRKIFGNKEWHQGTDFVSGLGSKAPIHAMADGTVSYASVLSTYGNVVRIKHKIDGVNYETLYAHLSKINVKVGQKVKQGDIVGIIGNTGRSTGIHLHAEIHVNGFWSKGQPLAKDILKYVDIKDTPSTLKNNTISTTSPAPYRIKSGEYSTKAQAEIAKKQVAKCGFANEKYITIHEGNGKYYFLTGTYQSKNDAEQYLQKMKDKKILWVGFVIKA